jgi:hypothetical protein
LQLSHLESLIAAFERDRVSLVNQIELLFLVDV